MMHRSAVHAKAERITACAVSCFVPSFNVKVFPDLGCFFGQDAVQPSDKGLIVMGTRINNAVLIIVIGHIFKASR